MSDDPKLHSAEWFRHQYRAMIEQMERWESQPGEGTRWSLLHPSLPPMPSGPHSLKWTERNWLAFCADCMLEKGRFLSGEFAHWCYECDGMAIDETCPEFQNCLCFSEVSVSEITQQLVAVVAEYDREIDALRAENERLRAERTALSNEVLDIVNSRPTSLNDDLYDWAYDAEEKLRRLIEENKGGER